MGDCPIWDEYQSRDHLDGCADFVWTQACDDMTHGRPLSDSIRGWHNGLFSSDVPLDYYAGNFRQNDSSRICLGVNVAVGDLPGSHYEDVRRHMVALEENLQQLYVHADLCTELEKKVKIVAKLVGQTVGAFIKIHPFVNGNGRTSRVLWGALLSRFGVSPQAGIVRRPGPPYDQIMESAMEGDYIPLVLAVLRGIADSRSKVAMPTKSDPGPTPV